MISKPSTLFPIGAAIFVLIGALNATLIYDDPFLVEHFRLMSSQHSLGETLQSLFFIVDLEGHEYRLYGLSKVIHFAIWEVAGAHAWVYGSLISGAQFASGIGIYRVLRRLNTDFVQASAVAFTWVLSPFAVTSCFHHYSYLLLPYQATLACALVLQHLQENGALIARWRLLLAALGFVLVTTGDSHLPATPAILALVACYTHSQRSWRSRVVDLAIVFLAMAVTLVVHRWGWYLLTSRFHQTHVRYTFAKPGWREGLEYTVVVLRSLPKGISGQIGPLFALAGPWVIITGIVIIVLAAWLWGVPWPAPVGRGRTVAGALFLILVASLLTIWALSIFTGQVSVVMPRRYGYVPNTVAAMLVAALLAAPATRRRFGLAPALVGVGGIAWLWLTLTAVCLPIVRAQDAKVWAAAASAIQQRQNASVLFVNTWNNFEQPGFVLGVGTPGLRGGDFPEIFESPLSHYWWESLYSVAVLGARFAAYRFDDAGPSSVRLSGNELSAPPVVVSKQSVVVLADLGLQPPEFPKVRHRVTVFRSWNDFESSVAANHGASIETGWDALLSPPPADEVEIDLGTAVSNSPGMLPDKRFQDPSAPIGLIANYGMEEGNGNVFTFAGPLSYLVSNRYGSYTYRVDFTNASSKIVDLDFMEIWHNKPGSRAMIVDAAFDDRWFHVSRTFDPAAFVVNAPLTLKLFPGSARTFRVRLAHAPGAADIPFLSGIRVSRVRQ